MRDQKVRAGCRHRCAFQKKTLPASARGTTAAGMLSRKLIMCDSVQGAHRLPL